MCRPCYEKWLREENPALLKRQQENSRLWKQANRDKAKALNKDWLVKKTKTDPLYRRNASLKKKYGITHDIYLEMLAAQNGGCAICNRKPAIGKHLHVDHCHTTLAVRGLLCHQCNWYLGTIDADQSVLTNLLNYLNKDK
jgi:hypothetical protein